MDDFLGSTITGSGKNKKNTKDDNSGFDFKKRKPTTDKNKKSNIDFNSLAPTVEATPAVALESAKFLPEEEQEVENLDPTNSFEKQKDPEVQDLQEFPNFSNGVYFSEGHSALVSSLAIDATKSRLATGSQDSTIILYDFGGMSSEFPYFKKIEPFAEDGGIYTITSLEWHPDSTINSLLVCSSGNIPKIYDREGALLQTCAKGDPYIQDRMKTMGHVAAVRKGIWHPRNKDTFITASEDSTMRIWKIDDCSKRSTDVVKMKNNQAKNFNKVMTICINQDGTVLGGAGQDGSIQFWRWNENKSKPFAVKWKAHEKECSSMCFSQDGFFVLTRGMDHAFRMWDRRKLTDPIFQQNFLLNEYEFSDCSFIGNNDQFFACTSTAEYPDFLNQDTVAKWGDYDLDYFNQELHTYQNANQDTGKDSGRVYVFNRKNLSLEKTINLSQTDFLPNPNVKLQNEQGEKNNQKPVRPIQRFIWDPTLQQIFIGSSNLTLGLYEKPASQTGAKTSQKGILLGINKGFKKRREEDMFQTDTIIINPTTMPFFRENDTRLLWKVKSMKEEAENYGSAPLFQTKKARQQIKDAHKARKATVSEEGKEVIGAEGHGGKLGTNYTQFYLSAAGEGGKEQQKKDFEKYEDPREALLKYAKIAEEEPLFVTPAYKKNQPNPIFQGSNTKAGKNAQKRKGNDFDDDFEENDFKKTNKKRRTDN